jgi:hypothetical protein
MHMLQHDLVEQEIEVEHCGGILVMSCQDMILVLLVDSPARCGGKNNIRSL